MTLLSRLLLTLFAIAFGAANFAQTTADAHMRPDMSMAPAASADPMPSCEDCCGDGGDGLACLMACTLPALGLLTEAPSFTAMMPELVQPLASWAIIADSRPPDPYPPKPSFPS